MMDPVPSIRARYERSGADAFYRNEGADYRNPHEPSIRRLLADSVKLWNPDLSRVLDLACGSGEVTLALQELGAGLIHGIDPYTFAAYLRRTGSTAERFTFADVAAGTLAGRRYSLIVCSFALHLCEPSRLPALMHRLTEIAPTLLILTPHKRPTLRPQWGWGLRGELVVERVRGRMYGAGEEGR